MKIRKLQLTGYKVFDELELDFTDLEGNMLDTVVLAGVNGSGKTSLLDLFEAIFSITEVDIQSPYKCHFIPKSAEELIENCTNLEFIIGYDCIGHNNRPMQTGAAVKLGRQFINKLFQSFGVSSLPPENYGLGNLIRRDINEEIERRKRFLSLVKNENFTCCYIKLDFLNDLVQQDVAKYLVDSLVNGVVQKRELPAGVIIQEIIDKINNMFDGMDMKTKLVDITATEPIFESFNGKKISINQLSSGEKQLFCQAAYLQKLNLQDSIILIDEPETSLHPTWQRNILKLYQNIGKNNQIIVATHSPHIIASVKPENLFVLYPNAETGKIEPINMAKAHKHTKGVEPNRILQEVMGMEDLRDPETQQRIDEIAELLRVHPELVDLPENEAKIEKLRDDLGNGDPFIIRMEHQLLLIKRRRLSQ
jgi:predicted ATP-dependent endonuclease of OLD family